MIVLRGDASTETSVWDDLATAAKIAAGVPGAIWDWATNKDESPAAQDPNVVVVDNPVLIPGTSTPAPRQTSSGGGGFTDQDYYNDAKAQAEAKASAGAGDTPWWPWLVGGLVLVGGGVGAWRLLRRKRSRR